MATPTLVQACSSENSASGTAISVLNIFLPSVSLANNCIVVCIQSNNTATGWQITDDKGNTWTTGPTRVDGQFVGTYVAFGAAAGTRHITATKCSSGNGSTGTPGGTVNFAQGIASEWYNVATSGDPTLHTATSLTSGTVAAGSFTPASTNDLVLHYGIDQTATPAVNITAMGPAAGYTPVTMDRRDGSFLQYRLSNGATNPTMTISTSTDSFTSVAFSLPNASAGTAPAAGIRIVCVAHYAVVSGVSSFTVDFPTTGNLMVASWITTPRTANISGILDNHTNSWTEAAAAPSLNVGTGDVTDMWYEIGATAAANTLVTVTLAVATNAGATLVLYDVTGAATSPYDTSAEAHGLKSVAGDNTTVSITPTTSNGLVIFAGGVESHCVSGYTTPTTYLNDAFFGPEMDGLDLPLDQNNGWAHVYNPDTSTLTFVETIQHDSAGVQHWTSIATAFKAPVAGTSLTPAVGSEALTGVAPSRVVGTVLTPITP